MSNLIFKLVTFVIVFYPILTLMSITGGFIELGLSYIINGEGLAMLSCKMICVDSLEMKEFTIQSITRMPCKVSVLYLEKTDKLGIVYVIPVVKWRNKYYYMH